MFPRFLLSWVFLSILLAKIFFVSSYLQGFGFSCGITSGHPLLLGIPPEGPRGETGARTGVSNKYSAAESASV